MKAEKLIGQNIMVTILTPQRRYLIIQAKFKKSMTLLRIIDNIFKVLVNLDY